MAARDLEARADRRVLAAEKAELSAVRNETGMDAVRHAK